MIRFNSNDKWDNPDNKDNLHDFLKDAGKFFASYEIHGAINKNEMNSAYFRNIMKSDYFNPDPTNFNLDSKLFDEIYKDKQVFMVLHERIINVVNNSLCKTDRDDVSIKYKINKCIYHLFPTIDYINISHITDLLKSYKKDDNIRVVMFTEYLHDIQQSDYEAFEEALNKINKRNKNVGFMEFIDLLQINHTDLMYAPEYKKFDTKQVNKVYYLYKVLKNPEIKSILDTIYYPKEGKLPNITLNYMLNRYNDGKVRHENNIVSIPVQHSITEPIYGMVKNALKNIKAGNNLNEVMTTLFKQIFKTINIGPNEQKTDDLNYYDNPVISLDNGHISAYNNQISAYNNQIINDRNFVISFNNIPIALINGKNIILCFNIIMSNINHSYKLKCYDLLTYAYQYDKTVYFLDLAPIEYNTDTKQTNLSTLEQISCGYNDGNDLYYYYVMLKTLHTSGMLYGLYNISKIIDIDSTIHPI